MNNLDYQRAVVLGFIIGAATTILGVYMLKPEVGEPPVQKEDTKVVGQYKDCDIVRWTQHQLAEYKYFMYCNK